ncbi:uncharacterized protein DUF4145 [Hazenella coriacea]|uniref:Uncharacterized protein DUF4145 n=1 Tax=Hazenella coriacea TaxID=1179467 RepID=A0A4R3L9Q7_9BACL|nr:uncharacterized protein DUF4145 [Hazenella coriacea]
MKLRLFAETLAKYILAAENIQETYGTKQVDRIHILRREGLLEPELDDIFEALRRKGNTAVHEAGYGKTEEAKALLKLAFRLSIWYMEVYGAWNFQAPEYMEPQDQEIPDTQELQREYEDRVKDLEEQLETIRQQAEAEHDDVKAKRKMISKQFIRRQHLTEAETRALIDRKLRKAGWEVDTHTLNHQKNGTFLKNTCLPCIDM